MDIGKEKKKITVEPLEDPVPTREPVKTPPEREPTREPEPSRLYVHGSKDRGMLSAPHSMPAASKPPWPPPGGGSVQALG